MQFNIPSNIQQRPTDTVTYIAVKGGKDKKEKTKAACYASCMNSLSEYNFWLFRDEYTPDPKGTNFVCPADIYFKWIDLLKDNMIVPRDVEAGVDESGGLTMFIPKGYSRHTVYATLCAYRWAESHAPMPYSVVKVSEMLPDLSFWQVMHYSFGLCYIDSGHSWCYISRPHNVVNAMQSYGGAYNLAQSLAMPIFWGKTEKEKDDTTTGKALYNSYTSNILGELTNSIGPMICEKGSQWPCLLVNALVDSAPEKSDILNPRWTPLYRLAGCMGQMGEDVATIRRELKKEYDRITEGDASLVTLREEIVKRAKARWY